MSLVATVLNEIRIKNEKLDKNEHRLSEYGALDFFVQQSKSNPLLTSEMKAQAIRSAGKTLKMPVINYDGNIAVSNVRSCSVQDAENTSALVGVTFATYAVGFTVVPAMYSNNEIDKQNDITKKYLKCARVLGAALDGAALTALDAAKTQVFADKLIYTEAVGGDVIDVPWASREDILSDIEPMMNANDYYGRVHIIGNNGVRSLLNKLAEKGTYNIVDKSLEWAGKEFHFTNRLANESGMYATFYAVEMSMWIFCSAMTERQFSELPPRSDTSGTSLRCLTSESPLVFTTTRVWETRAQSQGMPPQTSLAPRRNTTDSPLMLPS